jgi:2-polyprenyl-3-methyl-5-hydroxy-6-metoxy-1,4-benzoquinol methylase
VTTARTGAPPARRHGKAIDIARLKGPVLANLQSHVREIAEMAAYLAEHERPVAQLECYVCRSAASHPMVMIHGFQYVRCQDCGHVYTRSRYSSDAIEKFYRENEYYSRITYANRDTCDYRRNEVARPKVEFAEQYVGSARGTWLDVGAGIGDIVSVLVERGWQATGLELSAHSVAFAREMFGIDLLPQTLQSFDEARRDRHDALDVVSFFAILEHVTDPLELLRVANRLLKPDGSLVVQVPNANSLSSMIQTVFPEHVFRHMSPVSHIMLFTESSLAWALAQTGFEPVAFWFLGLDVYELVNTLVLLKDRAEGSELQAALMAQMNGLQQVLDRAEIGDGIICVARKVSG